jgi:hypothetical protein
MISNSKTRKDKRWAVLVKPYAVMLNPSAVLPIIAQTTWTITTGLSVSSGATTIELKGNKTNSLRINYPYRMFTTVSTDPAEVVYFTEGLYNPATGNTTLTLQSPVTRSYEVNSYIKGGAFSTALDGDVSAGATIINVEDNLGLEIGNYIALDNGNPDSEVVYVTGITGTQVEISDPLYFDHTTGQTVLETDGDAYNSGTNNLKYNITFDVVYGKLPGTTRYAQLCNGDKDPWIQIGETGSFQEAKDMVIAQANIHGLDNVTLLRVIDLNTVLYPIS